ncbi:hypothetical protein C8R44DRAFT_752642 [Mycena epipterygia]|nr:hypothetical protein C8R44DRAFT_752642 [Mycena epipterygia]
MALPLEDPRAPASVRTPSADHGQITPLASVAPLSEMPFTQRISALFGIRSTPPPADMRTIPCTGLDILSRDFLVTIGFVIDTRLDAQILRQSLSTIIEHKFPRAGARLIWRNGVYEFQIPRVFDADTPPVAFTAEDYPEPYRSSTRPQLPVHPLHFATRPSIQDINMPAFDAYFKSRECPTSLAGFLVPNTPHLHVHAAVFDDLTFIGLTFSHMSFDALGAQTLVHAWTRLLNGDAIETIPGMEWNFEPFEAFRGPVDMTCQRGWFELGLLSQLILIVSFCFKFLRDPKEEMYIVRVPKAFLEDSKREIMKTLKLQRSSEWVGSSDVLMAWWLKTSYSDRRIDDTTPIHIHLPVDIRDKPIFHGTSTLDTPYINNVVLTLALPPIPANAFRTESLANRIRRSIIGFTTDHDGMAADVHSRRSNPVKLLFPCPPRAEYSLQTNWRKARFGALDFSGACVGAATKPRLMCLGNSTESPVPGERRGVDGGRGNRVDGPGIVFDPGWKVTWFTRSNDQLRVNGSSRLPAQTNLNAFLPESSAVRDRDGFTKESR